MKSASKAPKKYKPKKKRKALKALLVVLLIIAATLIGFATAFQYVMKTYEETSKAESVSVDPSKGVEFVIERGATTDEIASDLQKRGLIKSAKIFELLSKINGYDWTYRSGTHIVDNTLSYDELMQVLAGDPAVRQVTIPEGKTFTQIVDLLYTKSVIKNKAQFIQSCNTEEFDYDFLKDIPARKNKLEGYLFPDTYEFDLNASDREIISKMLDNFNRKFRDEYVQKIKALSGDMTLDKVVTLASIIEREARISDDRYLISGVLYNRMTSKDRTLRKLQVDATIQYILLNQTGAYKDRLLYADLQIDDPYNTYLYEGLPPGPICCPGEASIKAALNPEQTDYLYYVATGDAEGSHVFSRTYKEHQAAVKKYSAK